jgi:hypothetical protein
MVFIGPISSIFDVVTFLVMWNVFAANTVEKQSLFQSGWFVVGLHHADADRAHDPHPTHPVHSEPGGYACYLINCQHYGVRHLPAVLTDRSAFGDGAVAAGVFRLAGWNFVELLLSYATGENGLHPPLWTVVVMS